MVPVLILLVAVIPLTLLLVLPRFRAKRTTRNLHSSHQQTDYEEFLASVPPERRNIYQAETRRHGYILFFVGILMVGAVISTYIYLTDWLDDRAALFVTSKPQQLHIFVAAAVGGILAGLGFLAWLQFRVRGPRAFADRFKAFSNDWLAGIPVAFFTWALLQSGISVFLFQIASTPVTIPGVVERAGTHVMRKSTNYHFADIRPDDGGAVLQIRSYKSLHSYFTGYDVRINQQCPLEGLPEGLPVVLHGRRSRHGFALDEITTTGTCR